MEDGIGEDLANRQERETAEHGPTGLSCQDKQSPGESCHRPLAHRWKETRGVKDYHTIPATTLHSSPGSSRTSQVRQHHQHFYRVPALHPPTPPTPLPLCPRLPFLSPIFLTSFSNSSEGHGGVGGVNDRSLFQILTATVNPCST